MLNNLKEDEIKKYFSTYGTVVNVKKERMRSQNYIQRFAYVTFEKIEVVDELVKTTVHMIKNHIVDIRKTRVT